MTEFLATFQVAHPDFSAVIGLQPCAFCWCSMGPDSANCWPIASWNAKLFLASLLDAFLRARPVPGGSASLQPPATFFDRFAIINPLANPFAAVLAIQPRLTSEDGLQSGVWCSSHARLAGREEKKRPSVVAFGEQKERRLAPNKKRGDLRSSVSAGSGDPRRTTPCAEQRRGREARAEQRLAPNKHNVEIVTGRD